MYNNVMDKQNSKTHKDDLERIRKLRLIDDDFRFFTKSVGISD